MTDQVQTETTDWMSLVESAEGVEWREDIIVYQFNTGQKSFTEPHDPEGRGIYE